MRRPAPRIRPAGPPGPATAHPRATRPRGSLAQPLVGVAILAVVLVVAGPASVSAAVTSLDAATLAAGGVLAGVTTAGAAWRWRVVARRLGISLSMTAAVTACYRAQFLNMTLPGGILGDVARGVGHGRAVDDVARGLRAVAWERTCGQVVLVAVTLPVLVAIGWSRMPWSAVPWWGPVAAVLLGAGVVLAVARRPNGLPRRVAWTVAEDARALAGARTVLAVLVASVVVLTGHVVTFALAARMVGTPLDASHLVPISLVVLLVGALPFNVAGWGPREGAAAWAFAASGLDASHGLTVAVAYGTIALVSATPGGVLLLAGRLRWPPAATTLPRTAPPYPAALGDPGGGAADG